MELVLFAIIGVQSNMGGLYWSCWTLYALTRLFKAITDIIKEKR